MLFDQRPVVQVGGGQLGDDLTLLHEQHPSRQSGDHLEILLHQQNSEAPSLPEIAQVLAMSPGHFAHAFRETTGLPPHRYVLERRVERAKSLLRGTNLPIIEIAGRIGCASHSHFSVMFHRMTGQAPRDYRNQD